jgi:hypothetical protein
MLRRLTRRATAFVPKTQQTSPDSLMRIQAGEQILTATVTLMMTMVRARALTHSR